MNKTKYASLKKKGVCTRCHTNPVEKGKSACRPCLDYIKEHHEKSRLKKNPNTWKAKAIRAETNCGELTDELNECTLKLEKVQARAEKAINEHSKVVGDTWKETDFCDCSCAYYEAKEYLKILRVKQ